MRSIKLSRDLEVNSTERTIYCGRAMVYKFGGLTIDGGVCDSLDSGAKVFGSRNSRKDGKEFSGKQERSSEYVADCESHNIILYQSQSSELLSASCRLFNLAGFQLISPPSLPF